MNRHRRGLARPTLWLLLAALLLGTLSPLASSGGALAEDPPAVEATEVPTDIPAEPTEVPVEPTDVPVEPTELPVEPTDEPMEPTAVPTDPGPEPSAEPSVSPADEPSVASATPTGESMPLMGIQAITTSGTITKTASTTNPAPGELVVFTITVSGEAEANTALIITDVYPISGVSLTTPQTSERSNVTDPASTYSTGGAFQSYDVNFSTIEAGAYSLTVRVMATIASNASGTLVTDAAIINASVIPYDNMNIDPEILTVASAAITAAGTITKKASNTTPDPGETVTFTITVTGRATEGTALRIIDDYDLGGLLLSAVQVIDAENVTDPIADYQPSQTYNSQIYYVTFAPVVSGAFSLIFQVDATVAINAPDTLDTGALLENVSQPAHTNLGSDSENLTVTTAPIVTTGTITKTASTSNPLPAEMVTFTITISGEAEGGTALEFDDGYQLPGLTVGTPQVGEHLNVSIPSIDCEEIPLLELTVCDTTLSVQDDGAYQFTYTVDVVVDDDATGTLPTYADLFSIVSGTRVLLSTDDADLTVAIPTTGTITKTASTTNPAPGETVTFTISVSGAAEGGTELRINDAYQIPSLAVGIPSAGDPVNVTPSTPDCAEVPTLGVTVCDTYLTLVDDGAYAFTFSVDVVVATDAVGTLTTYADIWNATAGGILLSHDDEDLTVPLAAPVVTKATTDLTPRAGDPVTYTITVSGSAAAGTELTVDDVLPAELTLVGVTPTGENLLVGDNQGGANAVSLLLTVQDDGEYGLTVIVEAVVNHGVARDTIITNTACVDLANGPQDTCASAAVTVLRPLTYLDRLLQWLVAILIGILGGL